MRTNLTSKLQLTDGLLTDQLTKRSRNWPLKLNLLLHLTAPVTNECQHSARFTTKLWH